MASRHENQPDFEGAKAYALNRLERELRPSLYYHSVRHTRDDVLPALERLAEMEAIEGEPLLLLRTAALFHDIGFVEKRNNHEALSVRIATDILPQFRYSTAQIATIAEIIMATRVPQRPRTILQSLLVDADLDVLGRDDFLELNRELRAELAADNVIVSDWAWYQGQLAFFRRHRYWTESAQALRNAGKQRNLASLMLLLERAAHDQPHGEDHPQRASHGP